MEYKLTHYQVYVLCMMFRAYGNLSFEHIARVSNTATSFVDTTPKRGLRKYFAAENSLTLLTQMLTPIENFHSQILYPTPRKPL